MCTSGSQRVDTQNIVGRSGLTGYRSSQHKREDVSNALEGRGKCGSLERRVKSIQKHLRAPRVGKGATMGIVGGDSRYD